MGKGERRREKRRKKRKKEKKRPQRPPSLSLSRKSSHQSRRRVHHHEVVIHMIRMIRPLIFFFWALPHLTRCCAFWGSAKIDVSLRLHAACSPGASTRTSNLSHNQRRGPFRWCVLFISHTRTHPTRKQRPSVRLHRCTTVLHSSQYTSSGAAAVEPKPSKKGKRIHRFREKKKKRARETLSPRPRNPLSPHRSLSVLSVGVRNTVVERWLRWKTRRN